MADAWWVFLLWAVAVTAVALWQQRRFTAGLAEAKRLTDELRHEMAEQGDEDWDDFEHP